MAAFFIAAFVVTLGFFLLVLVYASIASRQSKRNRATRRIILERLMRK